mgnify:FL=1
MSFRAICQILGTVPEKGYFEGTQDQLRMPDMPDPGPYARVNSLQERPAVSYIQYIRDVPLTLYTWSLQLSAVISTTTYCGIRRILRRYT